MRFLAPLLLLCLLAWPVAAQHFISGQVVEATSGEPVPFASVFVPKSNFGVTADMDGRFKLTISGPVDSLAVSALGFISARHKLSQEHTQTVLFRLKAGGGVSLAEVLVKPGENPAFRILREMERHKPQNSREALTAAEFDSYNRIEVSLADLPKALAHRKVVQDMRALAVRRGAAAAADPDAPLPIFASEVGSKVYQKYSPLRRREDIAHRQMRGAGPREGSVLSQLLGSNFQNFDFYPNWQNILSKDFISPIADNGRFTYNYELLDSVFVDKDWCYKLSFVPKRAHDLAFKGTMWITTERYALRRIDVVANADANINFVTDVRLFQDLTPPGEGPGVPTRTRLVFGIRPTPGQASMRVRFTTVNSNIVRNQPHDVHFYDVPVSVANPTSDPLPPGGLLGQLNNDGTGPAAGYFDLHRPDTLSLSERQTFAVLDSAKQLPSVRNALDWIELFVNGYKRVGKLDLGPILNVYSNNNFEGSRFQFGFRTTPDISNNWLTQAYVAYGTRDQRFKYGLKINRIIERRHWTVVGVEYRHDVDQAALLDNDFLPNNNLFAAASRWGRFRQGLPVLREIMGLNAQRDLFHGFTQTAILRYQNIDPLFAPGPASENMPGAPPVGHLYLTELVLESRYARDETLIQSENRRMAVGLKRWPVFSFRYTLGTIGWFQGDYIYHKYNLLMTHSLGLGQLGRFNYRLEGSYIPSQLPYIILKTPLGNQTPFLNYNAFNLMRYFEFVTDRSVSLRVEHHFEGLFLNSIPGIRSFNWRLVAAGNMLYGRLSQNNAHKNQIDPNNSDTVTSPTTVPYIEASYGIENIFKCMRVDFLHRLTYRDAPHTKNFGVKVGFQFRL